MQGGLFFRLVWIVILVYASVGIDSYAQVDPSSALLLRSSGKAPTKEGLDSSRYQVREKPQVIPDERRLQSSPPPTTLPVPVAPIEPIAEEKAEPVEVEKGDFLPLEESAKTPVLTEVLLGGSLENINEYRQKISADDYRQNIVDLTIETLYIYNDSSSNFWLRDYQTNSPGLNLGADVWITPFFGFRTSYQTSFSSAISKDFASQGTLPVDHEWFHAGLRFRKFFGVSKQSPGLVFGVDFSEYQLKIESSAQNRMGLKSSGAKLGVEAVVPKNDVFQWNLGFTLMPRVDHKQVDTGISAESGDSQQSTRVGVSVGGRFIFSRKSQFFWKLSHEVEKNLFEGETSINDPRTLAPVEGTEVTNSFSILSFGYTWGN